MSTVAKAIAALVSTALLELLFSYGIEVPLGFEAGIEAIIVAAIVWLVPNRATSAPD